MKKTRLADWASLWILQSVPGEKILLPTVRVINRRITLVKKNLQPNEWIVRLHDLVGERGTWFQMVADGASRRSTFYVSGRRKFFYPICFKTNLRLFRVLISVIENVLSNLTSVSFKSTWTSRKKLRDINLSNRMEIQSPWIERINFCFFYLKDLRIIVKEFWLHFICNLCLNVQENLLTFTDRKNTVSLIHCLNKRFLPKRHTQLKSWLKKR